MTLFINNHVQIEIEKLSYGISFDINNNRDGCYSYATLTREQAQSLIEMLQKAINKKD